MPLPLPLRQRWYEEIARIREKLRSESMVLVSSLASVGISADVVSFPSFEKFLSAQPAIELVHIYIFEGIIFPSHHFIQVSSVYVACQALPLFKKLSKSVIDQLEVRKMRVLVAIDELQREEQGMDVRVTAAIASALVSLQLLPESMSPIVEALLRAVKRLVT